MEEQRFNNPRFLALMRLHEIHQAEARTAVRYRPDGHRPLMFGMVMAGLGLMVVGLIGLFGQFVSAGFGALTEDLPPIQNVSTNYAPFQTAQIFDRNGTLLWEFNDPNGGERTVIPLNQVSQHLIDASLAAEDRTFYQNPGYDVRATLRSAFVDVSGSGFTGASTITQQLVRNVLIPDEAHEDTISRKLREMILAYRVTQAYSKDDILQMYLNNSFYGANSYGVEAASENYFGIHARDLDVAQAALIAGLVQSPSAYNPLQSDVPLTADGIPVATKDRQRYVLEQMAYDGFISQDEATQAYAEPLKLQPEQIQMQAPHWVFYIRDQVVQQLGEKAFYEGGLKIYTTLDLGLDNQMKQVLQDGRQNIIGNGGDNAALIAVNPKTGEILAYQGSVDFNDESIDGQVNLLTSLRQPGSSIKPVVYGEAFAKGWTPGTPILDEPMCWEDSPGHQWCPENFDNEFHGWVTARTAMGNSLNIPAVQTLAFDGVDTVRQLGEKMGISAWGPQSQSYFGLSLTLGGAEVTPTDMAQVYADLANQGNKIPLVAIRRIVDSTGNIVFDYKVPQPERVLDPVAAYMDSNILSDPDAKLFTYGPNTPLMLKQADGSLFPAASKTGTTDNYRDTWTDGYTPNLAMVVWVGNTDGHPMNHALSTMTAGILWPQAMNSAIQYLNLPPDPFPMPPGMGQQQVCGDTVMRPGAPVCRMDLFWANAVPSSPVEVGGAIPANVRNQGAAAPTSTPAPGH